FDAVVSTTALHWLRPDELAAVFAGVAALLRRGGAVVNGDHMPGDAGRPTLNGLNAELRNRRAQPARGTVREDWRARGVRGGGGPRARRAGRRARAPAAPARPQRRRRLRRSGEPAAHPGFRRGWTGLAVRYRSHPCRHPLASAARTVTPPTGSSTYWYRTN